MVTAVVASAFLTIIGLLKHGFMSSDTAGGFLFGNFAVEGLAFYLLLRFYTGYQESLAFCRDYAAGYSTALARCDQAPGLLYFVGLLGASLTIALIVTVVSLLYLRKSS